MVNMLIIFLSCAIVDRRHPSAFRWADLYKKRSAQEPLAQRGQESTMKVLKRLAVCLSLAGLMSTGAIAQADSVDMKRIVIGSNPSGSTYFVLASSISKLYQEQFGIRASAQPFAG